MAKKAKMTRRPIEYALYAVLVLMIFVALSVSYMLRKANQNLVEGANDTVDPTSSLGQITEETIQKEEAIIKNGDETFEAYNTEFDAIVSEGSGLYDETNF